MSVETHHPTCVVADTVLIDEIEAAVNRVPDSVRDRPILPWIGRDYGTGGPFGTKRVLVLGHSHYEWCELCQERGRSNASLARLTIYTVAAQLLRHRAAYNHHWPSIELAILGGDAVDEDRRQIWRSIAVANYIPRIVGWDHTAGPPTPAMWEEARNGFRPLLEELRPNIVLVLGKRALWEGLPEEDVELTPLTSNEREVHRCVYILEDGTEVVACRLRHPRAGLGAPWHAVVALAVNSGTSG